MERKFHGSESSLYGLFAPGNEKAWNPPSAVDAPLGGGGGSRRKIAIPFGMQN